MPNYTKPKQESSVTTTEGGKEGGREGRMDGWRKGGREGLSKTWDLTQVENECML